MLEADTTYFAHACNEEGVDLEAIWGQGHFIIGPKKKKSRIRGCVNVLICWWMVTS